MNTDNKIHNENKQGKTKKNMIIAIIVIAAVMVLLITASFIIDLLQKNDTDREEEITIDYNFYPADYEENIFENKEYTDLTANGFLSFCDLRTNVTLGFVREKASSYGKEVAFLTDMIYDIINGDNESYNSRFSDEYYKTHEKKNRFTMQMIYGVTISYISEESMSENGINYTKYFYSVEYSILNNNGTFRRDIGDGSNKQYFTLSDREGKLLIDSISRKQN